MSTISIQQQLMLFTDQFIWVKKATQTVSYINTCVQIRRFFHYSTSCPDNLLDVSCNIESTWNHITGLCIDRLLQQRPPLLHIFLSYEVFDAATHFGCCRAIKEPTIWLWHKPPVEVVACSCFKQTLYTKLISKIQNFSTKCQTY
jgi:hypothetical protein